MYKTSVKILHQQMAYLFVLQLQNLLSTVYAISSLPKGQIQIKHRRTGRFKYRASSRVKDPKPPSVGELVLACGGHPSVGFFGTGSFDTGVICDSKPSSRQCCLLNSALNVFLNACGTSHIDAANSSVLTSFVAIVDYLICCVRLSAVAPP